MSQMFKPPQGGNVPSNGVIQMSDCKLNDGVTWEAHDAALEAWAAVLRDVGSQAGMYSWFPTAGTGEHDVHFKSIYAYPNHLEFGKDYDRFGNGGLWKRAREILWPIASCDVPRLYDARLRRTAQIRE